MAETFHNPVPVRVVNLPPPPAAARTLAGGILQRGVAAAPGGRTVPGGAPAAGAAAPTTQQYDKLIEKIVALTTALEQAAKPGTPQHAAGPGFAAGLAGKLAGLLGKLPGRGGVPTTAVRGGAPLPKARAALAGGPPPANPRSQFSQAWQDASARRRQAAGGGGTGLSATQRARLAKAGGKQFEPDDAAPPVQNRAYKVGRGIAGAASAVGTAGKQAVGAVTNSNPQQGMAQAAAAIGTLGSAVGGPVGVAVGGLAKMAEVTLKVNDQIRQWGDQLHQQNGQFAQYSTQMSAVMAQAQAMKIARDQKMGDALSKSAMQLEESRDRAAKAWQPFEFAWREKQNQLESFALDVSEGMGKVLDKLTGGEFSKHFKDAAGGEANDTDQFIMDAVASAWPTAYGAPSPFLPSDPGAGQGGVHGGSF